MKNDQHEFGVPIVDNTPTGQIAMQGRFLRGISNSRNKPTWVKVVSIIFCLIFLMVPGVFGLFVSFAGYQEGGIMNALGPLIGGLVFTLAGLAGIKANLKF